MAKPTISCDETPIVWDVLSGRGFGQPYITADFNSLRLHLTRYTQNGKDEVVIYPEKKHWVLDVGVGIQVEKYDTAVKLATELGYTNIPTRGQFASMLNDKNSEATHTMASITEAIALLNGTAASRKVKLPPVGAEESVGFGRKDMSALGRSAGRAAYLL